MGNTKPERHEALSRLNALAGRWTIEVSVAGKTFGWAWTAFEWLEGKPFLSQRSEDKPTPDMPPEWAKNSPMPVDAIIGLDDSNDRYAMLYGDARGVFRIYQMTLRDGIWKMWREAPAFHQRFKGVFMEGGNVITAYWEFSEDGENWARDFDIKYMKTK